MHLAAFEQDAPFLAAGGDNAGSFTEWRRILVPTANPNSPTITDMITWGWIVPDARIIIPDEYFLTWGDYPVLGTLHEIDDSLVWADHLWYAAASYGFLYTRAPLTGDWYVHPIDRPNNRYHDLVDNALTTTTPLAPVTPKQHPNGTTYYPWIDYFPYWKAYELIEARHAITVNGPLLLTTRLKQGLQELLDHYDTIIRIPRWNLQRVQRTWNQRRELFDHLARYRAMRAALAFVPDALQRPPGPVQAWEPLDAARALASHRGLTAQRLEELIPEQLLTLANDWYHWKDRDGSGPGKEAIGQLQKDTLLAIEWLHALTGKTIDDYYDKGSPTGLPQPSLPLIEALPLDWRKAEDHFLRHYLAVRKTTGYDVVPPPTRLSDDQVRQLVRSLRHKSWLFTDWLLVYRSFHEGLGPGPAWDPAGTTPDRLLHDLTLLPLLTEKILLDVTGITGSTGKAPSFKELIKTASVHLETKRPAFAGAWSLAESQWTRYTDLKNLPSSPFASLASFRPTGSATPIALAKALLFFGLARNYFAHHYYQHNQIVRTPDGGALMGGIITATLYLTSAYFGIP